MKRDRTRFWLRVIVVAQGILLLAAIVLLLTDHEAPRTRSGKDGHTFLRWFEPLLIDVVAHLVVFYLFMAQGTAPASV